MKSRIHNITQPLIERAEKHPNKTSIIFIHQDITKEITASQFDQSAMNFALSLSNAGIIQDDLIILVLQHSEVLLNAFWGALYMGAIPSIFPYLTEKLDTELYFTRVKKLVESSNAKAIITYPEFIDELNLLLDDTSCAVLNVDLVVTEVDENSLKLPTQFSHSDKIAFLQHSSGTTGLQKGVALSHRAVLNQISSYSQAINLNSDDVIVSWLPLYHDMGLIAGFVMPLVAGIPLVLMSPFEWVRKPHMLLQAIHEYHGTLCWLPNFAYNHIARTLRPQFIEGINLSSWRAAINCSEPVLAESQVVFLNKLSPYGFSKKSLATCYAMAENTFAVTQSSLDDSPNIDIINSKMLQEERMAVKSADGQHGSKMVSCGKPIAGTEIRIVDGEVNLPERNVGEIAIRSDSMLRGYYHRPNLTTNSIRDGWFFTGDMGYMADGELYITGRKKDLIIVGGKNIYPQDLEAIANEINGIHPGRTVAFGIFDDRLGTESIVMVCELKEKADEDRQFELEHELRKKIMKSTEISLSDIRFVTDRWIIKTSSGKIAREDNRKKYNKVFRNT